jgi:hypothetical protein
LITSQEAARFFEREDTMVTGREGGELVIRIGEHTGKSRDWV